jgi:hypothetical protein
METDLGRKTKEEATATTTAAVRAELKDQPGPPLPSPTSPGAGRHRL